MILHDRLKRYLNVTENCDKFDFDTKRYSFNDVEEIIQALEPCQCSNTGTYTPPNGSICCFVCGKEVV
jgi:hypothetical protein